MLGNEFSGLLEFLTCTRMCSTQNVLLTKDLQTLHDTLVKMSGRQGYLLAVNVFFVTAIYIYYGNPGKQGRRTVTLYQNANIFYLQP
jgi:hypothetical protein